MDNRVVPIEPRLPYPTQSRPAAWGTMEVYEIPEKDKAVILAALFPFLPVPSLEDTMFDLHAEKTFRVSEFLVVRDFGMNMLVSPYYPESGGTVIDWIPPDGEGGILLDL